MGAGIVEGDLNAGDIIKIYVFFIYPPSMQTMQKSIHCEGLQGIKLCDILFFGTRSDETTLLKKYQSHHLSR